MKKQKEKRKWWNPFRKKMGKDEALRLAYEGIKNYDELIKDKEAYIKRTEQMIKKYLLSEGLSENAWELAAKIAQAERAKESFVEKIKYYQDLPRILNGDYGSLWKKEYEKLIKKEGIEGFLEFHAIYEPFLPRRHLKSKEGGERI